MKAVIVGAGIGGLAAAIALRRAGWDVQVVERASSARELGFALLLAPNAMHALGELGLAEAARSGGVNIDGGEMRTPDGTVLRRFDTAAARAQLGSDPVCILRPVLHGALLDAVGRDAITLAAPATGFVALADRVEVTLADGRRIAADMLVGADGVGSIVRKQLHPGEPPPRPSGLLAIRGLAVDAVQHLDGSSGRQYFGRGFEAGLVRAGESEVYWYMSLRADRVGGERNAATLAQQCAQAFHEPLRAIVRATRTEDMRLDELLEREPLARWGDGPVTLLGDAAHPMLPHAGQGAAQALEDAVALGCTLRDATSIEASLRRYEELRARRTSTVLAIARRNATMASMTNPIGCWMRNQVIRRIPQSIILKSTVDLGKPPRDP